MNLSNQVAGVDGRQGEPYGLKPLKYYMNPDDMEPSVAQIELFFKNTMRKIRNQCEGKTEMEKDREKWKDIFEELIELPIDNSVYTCYRKLREEAKKSKFELLVETVKEVILTRKKSKVNPNSIRDIKQAITNCSQITIVSKGKDVRICGSYVRLNQFIKDGPQMDMTNILTILATPKHQFKYLSQLDIKDAFKQCTLPEHILDAAVITTTEGYFRPLKEVFGIKSIPNWFDLELATRFKYLPIVRYLDDIIIMAESLQQHDSILSQCRTILHEWNLPTNPKKEKILVPEVEFLGHFIRTDGTVTPMSKYSEAHYTRPTSNATLQSFNGQVTYLKHAFPDFAKTMKLLYVKGNKTFFWNSAREEAWLKMLNNFKNLHTFTCINGPKNFIKIVPYADETVVSVLLFCDNNLFYSASRVLQNSELNYHIENKLLLITTETLKLLRNVMLTRKIVVVVPSTQTAKLLNDYVQHGSITVKNNTFRRLIVQTIPFDVSFIKEQRKRDDTINLQCDVPLLLEESLLVNDEVLFPKDQVRQMLKNDGILNLVLGKKLYLLPSQLRKRQLQIKDDLLWIDGKMYISQSLTKPFLQFIHSFHFSRCHMIKKIYKDYVLLNYSRLVEDFVLNCSTCMQARRNKNACFKSLQVPITYNERIYLDNAQYGSLTFYNIYEPFTRMCFAKRIDNMSASSIISVVEKYIEERNTPQLLISDNHKPLISRQFEDYLHRRNIIHLRSIEYRSVSNEACERAIQTIKEGLKRNLTLDDSVFCANMTLKEDGLSPLEKFKLLQHMKPLSSEQLRNRYSTMSALCSGDCYFKKSYSDDKFLFGKLRQVIGSFYVIEHDSQFYLRKKDAVNIIDITYLGETSSVPRWEIRDIMKMMGKQERKEDEIVIDSDLEPEANVLLEDFQFIKLTENKTIYEEMMKRKYAVATDAGCKTGKYAAAFLMEMNPTTKSMSKLDQIRRECGPNASAQFLEVNAIIKGLELIKPNNLCNIEVTFIIDSDYAAKKFAVINSWKQGNFILANKSIAKHVTHWLTVYNLVQEINITPVIIKVKSHSKLFT
uniref:Integrase catalytic domain-containing protein n=1 Tax=Strongyloides stercoralis TaxID=6248 RepID=A0A913I586_STRER